MTPTVRVDMVPASCLLPNSQRRLHYRQWAPVAAELRRVTGWLAWEVVRNVTRPVFPDQPVHIDAVIAWPKGRKACDYQAACHSLKSVCDGLQDAQWVSDDKQVVSMSITQTRDKTGPGWVELRMREAR